MEYVVLVDNKDNELGHEEKFVAHIYPAKLHRAFSVFILNDHGHLLVQKRNQHKRTWPGYWSNSCCSHPRPNELIELAAQRRLTEELGFTCNVEFLFKFPYEARFNHDWGENELDYVFLGYHNGPVSPNPAEIDDYAFVGTDKLLLDMEENGNQYTPWFRMCFRNFLLHLAGAEGRK